MMVSLFANDTACRRLILVSLIAVFFSVDATAEDHQVSFRGDVAPILIKHCVACHCARKAEGSYRIDSFDGLLKTGDSGIAPFSTADTGDEKMVEFLRRLTTEDESERMPLEGKPLDDSEVKMIDQWIREGVSYYAKDPQALLQQILPSQQYPSPPEQYPATIPITAIEFLPAGNELITGGYHEVLIWSLDGQLKRRIQNMGQQVFSINLHPDGKRVAIASGQPGREGDVRILDLLTGEIEATLARSADVIFDAVFSHDGKLLAVAGADKSIRLIDLESLEETQVILSHADFVTSLAWSGDDRQLVSGSRDKSAKVFDVESGQLLGSYQGHGAAVRGVGFVSNDTEAISSGADGKLHRWKIEATKKIAEVSLGGEGFKITSSSRWVLVPTNHHQVMQVDPVGNKVLATLSGQKDWALSSATNSDATLAASGAHNGEVNIWKIEGQELVHSWFAKP